MNQFDLLKSHIDAYTRKDGAVVQAHDDKRTKKSASKSHSVDAKKVCVDVGNQMARGDDDYRFIERCVSALGKVSSGDTKSKIDAISAVSLKYAVTDAMANMSDAIIKKIRSN